mmetsp:Transcript_1014/g.2253  ORF Transcript_1014/g.2253 Transcript_1014/m.2253 type:complete len:218 (-) Transcript_1014:53-706(-)
MDQEAAAREPENQTEEPNIVDEALSLPLFRTPTPTPSVFEWREQVQLRLKLAEEELARSRRAPQVAVAEPQPTHKNLRLLKEIEEDEQTFQRATTKAAIDAARAETTKAVERAVQVEQLCHTLDDEVGRQAKVAEKNKESLLESDKQLQEQINGLRDENRQLKDVIADMKQQMAAQAKHGKDIEDALYFLSDELSKAKDAAKKAEASQKGGRMGARK